VLGLVRNNTDIQKDPGSLVDPHWMDPDTAFYLNADPDP
jgi:hypothetical protein